MEEKIIKPTFPKSIEEHDKEVNDTWSEEILNSILNNYYLGHDRGITTELSKIFGEELWQHCTAWTTQRDPIYVCTILNVIFTLKYPAKMKFVRGRNYELYIFEDDPTSIYDHDYTKVGSYDSFAEIRDKMLELVDQYSDKPTCEYCLDGTNEFGKSLFKQSLNMCSAASQAIPFADIDVYITDKDEMEMLVTNTTDEAIAKQTIKIKYCPFCGKKLGGNYDDNKSN